MPGRPELGAHSWCQKRFFLSARTKASTQADLCGHGLHGLNAHGERLNLSLSVEATAVARGGAGRGAKPATPCSECQAFRRNDQRGETLNRSDVGRMMRMLVRMLVFLTVHARSAHILNCRGGVVAGPCCTWGLKPGFHARPLQIEGGSRPICLQLWLRSSTVIDKEPDQYTPSQNVLRDFSNMSFAVLWTGWDWLKPNCILLLGVYLVEKKIDVWSTVLSSVLPMKEAVIQNLHFAASGRLLQHPRARLYVGRWYLEAFVEFNDGSPSFCT